MSSSPPQSSGPFTPLTGYQVVEYLKEQAHYLGELGYSTNFSEPDAFFQNITRQRKNDQSPSTTKPDAPDPLDEDQIVQKALHNVTMTERLLLHRQSLLTDVRNLPVVAEAERYIDHRLRSLGKSERYLSSTSLRGKIVNMIETTSPKPKENGVTMMIYMPGLAPTKDDMVKIQMPLKACIEDVHDVLEDLLRAEMSYVTGYVMKEFDKWERKPWPCWQYQIAARGKKRPVDAVFAALHTNEDYKRLISKVGAKLYTGPDDSDSKQVVEGMVEGVDDLLDEDGNRYFDPINWELMGEKFESGLPPFVDDEDICGREISKTAQSREE